MTVQIAHMTHTLPERLQTFSKILPVVGIMGNTLNNDPHYPQNDNYGLLVVGSPHDPQHNNDNSIILIIR
jgi:hypothetical protein